VPAFGLATGHAWAARLIHGRCVALAPLLVPPGDLLEVGLDLLGLLGAFAGVDVEGHQRLTGGPDDGPVGGRIRHGRVTLDDEHGGGTIRVIAPGHQGAGDAADEPAAIRELDPDSFEIGFDRIFSGDPGDVADLGCGLGGRAGQKDSVLERRRGVLKDAGAQDPEVGLGQGMSDCNVMTPIPAETSTRSPTWPSLKEATGGRASDWRLP